MVLFTLWQTDIVQPYIIYVPVFIFMHTSIYLATYFIWVNCINYSQIYHQISWLLISYMCTGSEWYSGHSYLPNKIWGLAVQLILVLPVKGGIKQLCSILASHSILNGTWRKEKKMMLTDNLPWKTENKDDFPSQLLQSGVVDWNAPNHRTQISSSPSSRTWVIQLAQFK